MENANFFTELKAEVSSAIEVLKLNKEVMTRVSGQNSATKWGIVFLVVPSVAYWIISALSYPSGFGVMFKSFVLWSVFVPVLSLAGMAYGVGFFAERFLKALVKPLELFRIMAYVSILLVIPVAVLLLSFVGIFGMGSLLSLLMLVCMIWMLVAAYNFLLHVKKMPANNVYISIGVGILIYFVVSIVLGNILIGSYFRVI